jgi:hypothetical protein
MKQLLIDGVTYDAWTPPKEDDLEKLILEHVVDIFGQQSVYFDIRRKLKSDAGIGSIPDGYCIVLRDKPSWYIVEVELSSHDLYNHIYSQLGKFLNGIKNTPSQHQIVGAIYDEINREELLKVRFKKALGYDEIHKFLSDLISTPPIIAVIIEKATQELMEVIERLKHPQTEVVEFQTFVRRDIGEKVHAHLFSPIPTSPTTFQAKTGLEHKTQHGLGKIKGKFSTTKSNLPDDELSEALARTLQQKERKLTPRLIAFLDLISSENRAFTRDEVKKMLHERGISKDFGQAGVYLSNISQFLTNESNEHLRQIIAYQSGGARGDIKDNYSIPPEYHKLVRSVLAKVK